MTGMYAIDQWIQTQLSFMGIALLVFLGFAIWSMVWSAREYERKQRREDAKLAALQRIANALSQNQNHSALEPMWSDTRQD